jgi:hypothetical protein
MKNIIKITLVTILAIGLNTGRATANDEAAAAIGGFVLGMITGAVIDNNHDHVSVSVRGDYGHRPRGHWETRRVRVWVPGYWDVRINRCGDRIRVYQKGHYSYRHEKVWVSYDRRGRGHDKGWKDHGRGGDGYRDRDRGRDRHDDRGYRG